MQPLFFVFRKVPETRTSMELFHSCNPQLQNATLGALCGSPESPSLKVTVKQAGTGEAELVKHCGCLA